ncbi:hypothetical protein DL769_003306 [Monosporascus sp. CRB-8-3]|nr:hypothetical protein DL769_003306 [Monosporascus sp. CRB-8-3]
MPGFWADSCNNTAKFKCRYSGLSLGSAAQGVHVLGVQTNSLHGNVHEAPSGWSIWLADLLEVDGIHKADLPYDQTHLFHRTQLSYMFRSLSQSSLEECVAITIRAKTTDVKETTVLSEVIIIVMIRNHRCNHILNHVKPVHAATIVYYFHSPVFAYCTIIPSAVTAEWCLVIQQGPETLRQPRLVKLLTELQDAHLGVFMAHKIYQGCHSGEGSIEIGPYALFNDTGNIIL